VLVVAHGALNRAIVCAAGYKEIKDFWNVKYLNCCLTTLEIKNGEISLLKEAEIFYDSSKFYSVWSEK
jgi:broad specificity phosphatase PhoE